MGIIQPVRSSNSGDKVFMQSVDLHRGFDYDSRDSHLRSMEELSCNVQAEVHLFSDRTEVA